MYRPSANPPKTAWARHLDQVMRDRGWSRVRLFEEVGGELGYSSKSRSAMLPLLEDKEPSETQAAVLRRHFGEPPAEPAATTAQPEPSLAELIKAQTAAIDRQTKMLGAVLLRLGGQDPTPQEWLDWLADPSAAIPSRLPTPVRR